MLLLKRVVDIKRVIGEMANTVNRGIWKFSRQDNISFTPGDMPAGSLVMVMMILSK
jgi:hypothetical protein